MSDVNLNFDEKAERSMKELKEYFGLDSDAAIITRALALLQAAMEINKNQGEIMARQGNQIRKIRIG